MLVGFANIAHLDCRDLRQPVGAEIAGSRPPATLTRPRVPRLITISSGRRCPALDERIIAAKAGTAHLRCSM